MVNTKLHKSSFVMNDIEEASSTISTSTRNIRRKSSNLIEEEKPRRGTETGDDFRISIIDETGRKLSEGAIIDNEKHCKSEERLLRTNSIISQSHQSMIGKLPVISSIKDGVTNHKKWSSSNIKHGHSTEEIISRVNYIYMKFIKSYSDYELNLTAKCVKRITEFVEAINKLTKNNELVSILNVSGLNFDNVFDQAYEEVLDTLYLNVYMQYVVKKQQKDNKFSKVKA